MAGDDKKPVPEWEEPAQSTDFRELFRYGKGGRIRSYGLTKLPDGNAEMWVVSEGGGEAKKSRKLMTLTEPKDAVALLESIQQELRAGGWVEA